MINFIGEKDETLIKILTCAVSFVDKQQAFRLKEMMHTKKINFDG